MTAANTSQQPENTDSPQGLGFAFGAYFLWGFLPLYMKLVAHVPPAEVVTHRVLWSVPLAGALLLFLRRLDDLKAALRVAAHPVDGLRHGCADLAQLGDLCLGDQLWLRD